MLTQQQDTWLEATLKAQRETSGRLELQALSLAGRSEAISESCFQSISAVKEHPLTGRQTGTNQQGVSLWVDKESKAF